jgi:glycosyltransferase involved in cell wall biosynthesis
LTSLLIISPHFPPSSLPPAQRARLLAKHFKDLEIDASFITVSPGYRDELEDHWLTELAGHDFRLVECKAIPIKWARRLGFGDLGLRALPFLLPAIVKFCRKEKPQMLLYPVPPWYTLMFVGLIKHITGIPYAIDFIDPWVEPHQPEANFRKKISQWLARRYEKKACRSASIIYSVSEGINSNLQLNYKIAPEKLHAIPYGVEPDDFKTHSTSRSSPGNEFLIRYTGAVWENANPVLDGIMKALKELSRNHKLRIEFTGTSYASGMRSKKQMDRWVKEYSLSGIFYENPLRVSYKRAVELTLSADLLLLFGGMEPYYAASKLMGLVASQRPFLAFVHKDSFPARFLSSLKYPYLLTYSTELNDSPVQKSGLLYNMMDELVTAKQFHPVDLNNPLFREHTAFGMTKKFVEPIQKYFHEQNQSLRKN